MSFSSISFFDIEFLCLYRAQSPYVSSLLPLSRGEVPLPIGILKTTPQIFRTGNTVLQNSWTIPSDNPPIAAAIDYILLCL